MPIVFGGAASVADLPFAVVRYGGATISNWDGSAVPFDTVVVDTNGLWHAATHRYIAQVAGWYRVAMFYAGSVAQISIAASAGTGGNAVNAQVYGAGDNVYTRADQHTQVTSGVYTFPPFSGITQLDVADEVTIEGDGGTGWSVVAGVAFSIERVA